MPARYLPHFFDKAVIADRPAGSLVLAKSLDCFCIEKSLLPSIAPLGHVVWIAGCHYSCDPIHDFGNSKLDHSRSIIKYGVLRIGELVKLLQNSLNYHKHES